MKEKILMRHPSNCTKRCCPSVPSGMVKPKLLESDKNLQPITTFQWLSKGNLGVSSQWN
jgi:hypothetical protein